MASATSVKPRLSVYLANDDAPRSARYTLATALGQPLPPGETVLDAEKHAIHLHPDIHRDHACACAVLVVGDRTGVDEPVRLAAVHARREGVQRFILLIHQSADERVSVTVADRVEREARGLLEALGVDGNDVPVVRSPLAHRGPVSAAMTAGMRDLLAALDDLPAFLGPAPLRATPPQFAREAALLDAVRPLLAPASRLAQVPVSLADTEALPAGSTLGGAPYLDRDEPWPRCPACRLPMGGQLQVDRRDVHHGAPPSHGLFVVFVCDRCGADEIRHHPVPSDSRRRRGSPEASLERTADPRLLRPGPRCWSLPAAALVASEHPDVADRLRVLTGVDDPVPAFLRVAAAMGVHGPQVGDRFGGHHDTDDPVPTPRCDVCEALCTLVVQIAAHDHTRSLWACRDHPSFSVHRVHS